DVAVLVHRPDVTGGEPAVLLEDVVGGLRVVPVAPEHHVTFEEDLAVFGDGSGRPRNRLADGADLHPARRVDGGRRRCLGQAVALEDGDADAAEEVAQTLAEAGATADAVLDPPAEGITQLLVDETVEDSVEE